MGFTATGIVLVFHQIPFSPLVMLVTHGAICKGKGRNYFLIPPYITSNFSSTYTQLASFHFKKFFNFTEYEKRQTQ
jgi:hypothetical protein